MMCWHFDSEHCELVATPSCERYARTYTVVVLAAYTGCFTFAHLYPERFHLPMYNRTGNFYETLILRSTCVVLVLLYVILYVRRHRHRELVQHLLRLNRRCVDSSSDRQFRNNLILYGVLTVLCFGNYLYGYSRSGLAATSLAFCMVVYIYAFLVICLLLVLFVCFKQIMAAGLVHYNRQLCQGDLATGLRGRQQLLAVCGGELNDCFGLLMLPIVALVLLMAPSGPFYMISTVMEGKFDLRDGLIMLFISCSWDVPWMVMLVLMLRTNGIAVEVSGLRVKLEKQDT